MPELAEVVRTTAAVRRFTKQPVADEDVAAVLELARFASSGGNQQGWRVVAVRSAATKRALMERTKNVVRRYVAEQRLGERPYNTVVRSRATEADVAAVPDHDIQWYLDLAQAPVMLVVGLDLSLVASIDRDLDRIGVVSGGSVYPFVHNILLAARARGLGGVLTTFAAGAEPAVKELLSLPASVAVSALVPLGYPERVVTRLSRRPVREFARWESWTGEPIDPDEQVRPI